MFQLAEARSQWPTYQEGTSRRNNNNLVTGPLGGSEHTKLWQTEADNSMNINSVLVGMLCLRMHGTHLLWLV